MFFQGVWSTPPANENKLNQAFRVRLLFGMESERRTLVVAQSERDFDLFCGGEQSVPRLRSNVGRSTP